MNFETLTFKPNFYHGLLGLGLKIAILAIVIYIILAIFCPQAAKNSFQHLKLCMNIVKFLTCLIIVMLVFCYDYDAMKVVFFVSLDGMSFSTFSVGALALWELIAMISDFLSVINDNLPSERFKKDKDLY